MATGDAPGSQVDLEPLGDPLMPMDLEMPELECPDLGDFEDLLGTGYEYCEVPQAARKMWA